MKAFISHSWKNKTIAQKIADELKASGVELWLDANNLLPGQLIQDTIDEVLKKMDVIVLVWSKEASESEGVAAEVFTCSKLKKLIIPCKIDKTPLSKHAYLRQIKGIGFQDFNDGVGRLKMVLLNYMTKDFNMQDNESIKKMNEFMGTLETANHLIYKEKIKNAGTKEEKDFWIKKIEDTYSTSYKKLKEEESTGKEVTVFLNEKMNELQSGLNNKKAVAKVLKEMKAYKYAGRPAMEKFIAQVETIYKSFDNNKPDDAIINFKKEMTTKLESSKQELKNSMGWLADMLFATTYENVNYFFLSSADHLEKLKQLSKQKEIHPVVLDCANELLQYIKTPGGVIDNNQYGILGYSDDAYFIHGLLATLQQEGIIDTAPWNIDWNKIAAGGEFVFNLVGQDIKNILDQNIYNFCRALVKKYSQQPQEKSKENYQQQVDNLQKAKDDLWKAKLMSLQTSMIQSPIY